MRGLGGALERAGVRCSDLGLGLAEALHAVAFLPVAAFLKKSDTLETLQDVALDDDAGAALEALVL
jgi:hypothetical protein